MITRTTNVFSIGKAQVKARWSPGPCVILHDHGGLHVYLQENGSLLIDCLSMFMDS
jgi:hypothetical protein